MKIQSGDLVKHNPAGSAITVILQKIDSANAFDALIPDFVCGIVIETSGKKCRVYSPEIKGLHWYENSELNLQS